VEAYTKICREIPSFVKILKISGTFHEYIGTFFIFGGSASPEERSLRVKLYQTILLIWF